MDEIDKENWMKKRSEHDKTVKKMIDELNGIDPWDDWLKEKYGMNIKDIEQWLEKNYEITVKDLKRKIAQKSIDMRKRPLDFSAIDNEILVVRLFKGGKKFLIQELCYAIDWYTNEDRFRYDFSIYPINEFPIYSILGEEDTNGFVCLVEHEMGDYILKDDVEDNLIRELIDYNFKGFNEKFYEFLVKLYKWSLKVN